MSSALKFPSDLMINNAKKNFVKFEFYDKIKSNQNIVSDPTSKNLFTKRLQKPIIYLPLTNEVFREIITTAYVNQDLGVLGSILYNQSAQLGSDITSASAISEVFKNAFDADTTIVRKALETYATTKLLTADAESIRSLAYEARMAYNPNMTLFFNGSQQNYRFFQLSWLLIPRSETEAETILKIEKTLLKNVLPETISKVDNRTFNYNNHFKYPKECIMTLYVDNVPFEKFKFLPSIIKFLDVSHQDNQQTNELAFSKKDDKSKIFYTSTTLNLGIQEKEIYIKRYIDQLKPIFNENAVPQAIDSQNLDAPSFTNNTTP